MKPLLIVSLLLAGVTVIVAVIATAIDYWMYKKVPVLDQCSVVQYYGLWEGCLVNKGCQQTHHECHKLNKDFLNQISIFDGDVFDAVRACRGLMITAILIMAVAIPVLFVKGTVRKIAPFCSIVGGLLCLIACIVFGAKVYGKLEKDIKKDTNLHAGFGLTIMAVIFSWISAAVMLIGTRHSGYHEL